MQVLLMIHSNEAGWAALPPAEQAQRMAAYRAYTEALTASGALTLSARLKPAATAQLVRAAGGAPQVLDGPYAETREQLGGFYLLDVPDLAAARDWAARCPGAEHGTVELREIWA
ncbi:MAG TPA: YciI family protein [Crenalkalicoccus sp.]|jgi:hypothetical protein|nr:YciI family protein [Crenalkalicoccus sp.]